MAAALLPDALYDRIGTGAGVAVFGRLIPYLRPTSEPSPRGTSRLVATFLYGVSGTDWSVALVSVCTLIVVAAIACYLPARQATRIDPIAALRTE